MDGSFEGGIGEVVICPMVASIVEHWWMALGTRKVPVCWPEVCTMAGMG